MIKYNLTCKCGESFCANHMHAHNCVFDYKTAHEAKLREDQGDLEGAEREILRTWSPGRAHFSRTGLLLSGLRGTIQAQKSCIKLISGSSLILHQDILIRYQDILIRNQDILIRDQDIRICRRPRTWYQLDTWFLGLNGPSLPREK